MSDASDQASPRVRPSATEMLGRTAKAQFFDWSDRDFLLYALAMGLGEDPSDEGSLRFVYEKDLRVLPTFPTVLAWLLEPSFASLGATPEYALHAGQKIDVHRALSGPTTVSVSGRVVAVHDKGVERGALITMRHEMIQVTDGAKLATLTTTCFARDCGGCGSAGESVPPATIMPGRAPDLSISYAIRPDAALLYRLTGDRNPLHAEAAVAAKAGFERPILHGLCTFGMTCRAVLETLGTGEASCIITHEARFSAPVYPGDTLAIALWNEGQTVCFEVVVPSRGVKVLTGGRSLLERK